MSEDSKPAPKLNKDFTNIYTVGGQRSDATGSANDWTPRDALLDTLQLIDSGKLDISKIVIICKEKGNPGLPGFSSAGDDGGLLTSVGMVAAVLHKLNTNSET